MYHFTDKENEACHVSNRAQTQSLAAHAFLGNVLNSFLITSCHKGVYDNLPSSTDFNRTKKKERSYAEGGEEGRGR